MKNCVIGYVATILASVGAINWGFVGALDFNLVSWLAGLISLPILETVVYLLVGISGIVTLVNLFLSCESCRIK